IAVGKSADRLDLPFPLLDDGTAVRAPIAGVVAGLRAAANDVCIVLPVDTPRMHTTALRALADACADVAVPQTGPLPGAFQQTPLPARKRAPAAGELSLRDATPDLAGAHLELAPALLVNVNPPGALARI